MAANRFQNFQVDEMAARKLQRRCLSYLIVDPTHSFGQSEIRSQWHFDTISLLGNTFLKPWVSLVSVLWYCNLPQRKENALVNTLSLELGLFFCGAVLKNKLCYISTVLEICISNGRFVTTTNCRRFLRKKSINQLSVSLKHSLPSTNAFTHYSVHRFAVTTACNRVIASLPFALVGTRLQGKLLHGDITAGTPLY